MLKNLIRILALVIYAVGCVSVFYFGILSIFGSDAIVNPEAMLPVTQRESAFMNLAIGALPMVLSCACVQCFCKLNRKISVALIYLPGVVAGGCLLFIFALLFVVGPLFN